MRIGIDARLAHHQRAGITRYTRRLLEELVRLDSENEYWIFQHRRHLAPLVTGANFRRRTLYAPVHHPLEQLALSVELFLVGQSLDLVHWPDFIPALYTPLPAVITVHDLAFLRWPHFLTREHARYYSQIDRAVRKARHIIVPSQSTKEDVIQQLGAPANKVTVIYEAAAPFYRPMPLEEARAHVQQRYGLPDRYILFVSTIEPRKNLGGLLQAFHHLVHRYNVADTALALVGKPGWLYEQVYATVEELGLEERVHFLGRVPDQDLRRLYVAARCHVHPAFYEGFGLPPLEAMACGTPTIVSNVSSLPEVVGDAALLVDPNNWEEIAVAIHRLLTDQDLHAELRAKGLERAKVFSWRRAARETLEVYRMVVQGSKVTVPEATHSSQPS